MTTRTRTRPAIRPRPARRTWVPDPRLAAGVALAAEAGHLAGALFEWPASAPRGIFHILAASALGVLAVFVYFGQNRAVRILGITLAATLPSAWLAGGLMGNSPYADFPIAAATLVTLLELALIALLAYPNE